MSNTDILRKIEEANLVGRGGAAFPAHLKWKRIKKLEDTKKYVVCNASEGEIGVAKDIHILRNWPEKVIKGMLLAMDFLETKEAFINFNKNYYQEVKDKIDPLIDDSRKKAYLITIFQEEPSYIGGESGALLNAIEGKKTQPRPKDPSPSLTGIHGNPVLLHNVETLYNIALVEEGKFNHTRFSTVLGVKEPGVYEFRDDITVAEALRQTNNYPDFDFFVQVGGGASGLVMTKEQAETASLTGCGSIEVYPADTKPYDLLKKWFDFYKEESCGHCTPCREGSWQLWKAFENLEDHDKIPWPMIARISRDMEETSFCGLGKSLPVPVESYMKNILKMEVEDVRNSNPKSDYIY